MKKSLLTLVCLAVMMMAGIGLRAQEVTITLLPGWTWISYPQAVPMELNEALGDFVPAEGDIIKSQSSYVIYWNGSWLGDVMYFMPGRGYKYYSSRSEAVSFIFAQPSSSVVATATPTDITAVSAVVGGMVMLPEGSHVFLRGVCWGTTPSPDIDGNHTTNGTGIGMFTTTLDGLNPNTTYYVRAYAVSDYGLAYGNQQSFTTIVEYQYVDLGLPSGTLWATINVGANAPEEYGDYFAWGEISPKDYYDWSNYLHSINNGSTLIKYVYPSSYVQYQIIDSLTVLMPEDDAATANWGEDWRMPTKEEWQELYQSTSHEWTTQDGVNGMLFTAQNGNSIFLPAAGTYSQSGLNYEGDQGMYWSSNLVTDFVSSLAWCFRFMTDDYAMIYGQRQNGYPVRPVRSGVLNPSFIIDATANPAEGGVVTGGGYYFEGTECTLTATANEGYTFTNWTENDEVVSVEATYTFTVNADRTLVANFTYNGGGDDHEYVDLGLPSGLLWATCNVGADNPEDYGDYFAWGETTTKDTYNGSTYQYYDGSNLTKYTGSDGLTTLLPEDDAATANWGSGWRMPTQAEFQELLDHTIVTWTTQNGVNGRLFTASNGNSLFLPAAGYRNSSSLNDAGSDGYYWSSSLYWGYPLSAWILYFNSGYYGMDYSSRDYGQSVRPVRSSGQNNAPTGAINGKFTINEDGDQVYFSQGNLQYQASTDTWKFADNQYDYVGSTNSNISSSYSGWIDLFGWGTSGWNSGNTYYHPWDSDNSDGRFYGPWGQHHLIGSYANADWGVYNTINNGCNTTTNHWRTLNQSEWNYVFNTRSTTSGIRYAMAIVNGVNGIILLPDDWNTNIYSLSNTNNNYANFSSNTITFSQWTILEDSGAVFLPATGRRYGTSTNDVGSNGYYWSASALLNSDYHACSVDFYDGNLDTDRYAPRCWGFSVRLVLMVED